MFHHSARKCTNRNIISYYVKKKMIVTINKTKQDPSPFCKKKPAIRGINNADNTTHKNPQKNHYKFMHIKLSVNNIIIILIMFQ